MILGGGVDFSVQEERSRIKQPDSAQRQDLRYRIANWINEVIQ